MTDFLALGFKLPSVHYNAKNELRWKSVEKENRMAPAGLKVVEIGKQKGTWDGLNDVENNELAVEIVLNLPW